jgi:hypothetical protein
MPLVHDASKVQFSEGGRIMSWWPESVAGIYGNYVEYWCACIYNVNEESNCSTRRRKTMRSKLFLSFTCLCVLPLMGNTTSADVFTVDIFAPADTDFGDGVVATLTSEDIIISGKTFQISFDVTPIGSEKIVSNASGYWGVGDPSFTGTEAVSSISNLQVVGLTGATISDLSFSLIDYQGAVGAADSGFLTAGANTGHWTDLNSSSGQFPGHGDDDKDIDLKELAGTAIVLTLSLGAENDSTAWRVNNITVSGDFTVVPEPSSLLILGFGTLLMAGRRRRV